jgi:hypothetical protein
MDQRSEGTQLCTMMEFNMLQTWHESINDSIDIEFICRLEGDCSLSAYIQSNSAPDGVCVAGDLNLGLVDDIYLRKLGLNPTLIGKLYPYLGRQGIDAHNYLEQFPLTLSKNEIVAINHGNKRLLAKQLAEKFDEESLILFANIPSCWQTVIASIEIQHGDISKTYPAFWRWALNQKWDQALMELRDFGDGHSERRNAEADYIVKYT